MFKARAVTGLTSAQSLVQDTQKDVNKEGIIDHKERNNTAWSAWKLNGAHHGVMPLVEIQIMHLLLLFFDIFLILYHLNRKHTSFPLNWTEGVAYKNSTIFSTKFKASSRLWVRCLRSQIWASSREQTRLGGVWLDAKFDSTQFFKKYLNPSSYAKVMTVLPKRVRVTVLKGRIWLGSEIG
jgi:hypothetical protein